MTSTICHRVTTNSSLIELTLVDLTCFVQVSSKPSCKQRATDACDGTNGCYWYSLITVGSLITTAHVRPTRSIVSDDVRCAFSVIRDDDGDLQVN